MVVDMRGGEDLPGKASDRVTSIGEFMLFDDQGNFLVRNELDDYEDFRRYTLQDELKMGSTMGGPMGGGSGMSLPSPDMGMGSGSGGTGLSIPGTGFPGGSGMGGMGIPDPSGGGGGGGGGRRGRR